jgi:hypothetical protein
MFFFEAEDPDLTFIELLAAIVGWFGNAELENDVKEYGRMLIEFNSYCYI